MVAPYLKGKFPHLKIGGYASCGFYAGSKEKPFTLDMGRPRQSSPRCRVVDEKRTWKEIPLPAALPPRSVLLAEFDPQ